jgi:hypothetical protein
MILTKLTLTFVAASSAMGVPMVPNVCAAYTAQVNSCISGSCNGIWGTWRQLLM